jgi:hypothetical protein
LNSRHPNQSTLSRRAALKALLAAGSVAGLATLPERWQSPLIEVGMLPAHARTSPGALDAFYDIIRVRQLTPCENLGRHHIFVRVQDSAGQGINGVSVRICWGEAPDACAVMTTQTQSAWAGPPQPGWAVFVMFRGTYSVIVTDGHSQVANGLTPDFAVDEPCGADDHANSLYRISFEVVFEQSN